MSKAIRIDPRAISRITLTNVDTMRVLSFARTNCFPSTKRRDDVRQSDVGSLMRDRRVKPRFSDKSGRIARIIEEEDLEVFTYRRNLTGNSERSRQERQTRGVSSKESAGRGLMILVRDSKNWGEARGQRDEKKKKRRGRAYIAFFFRAHTDISDTRISVLRESHV